MTQRVMVRLVFPVKVSVFPTERSDAADEPTTEFVTADVVVEVNRDLKGADRDNAARVVAVNNLAEALSSVDGFKMPGML